MSPLTQSTSMLSKAQTLLKDALVKLSKLDSDSYLLVISKCPILCLDSVDASVQHTGDDSALVLHLHKFNVLVDHVLQLQNGDTDSDAPKMRQRFARAFQVPLKVPFTGTRRKKAAVGKLVDSAHVLQVILQTNKQHQATHYGSTGESPGQREASQACIEPTGNAQQLTVTTSTSSTDKAGTTLGISNLDNSVLSDTKLDDLTTRDSTLWRCCDAKCPPVGHMGTPCGGNSRTQTEGNNFESLQLEIPQRQGLHCSGAESGLASTGTSGSSHIAAHRPRVTTPPVPRLHLGGLSGRLNSAGLGATCSPAASPMSTDTKASEPMADVECGCGTHLAKPGDDSLHSVSFRDVTSSRCMAEDAHNNLGERLPYCADSVMITPVRNSDPCLTLESGVRLGRKHISPSRLGNVATPCSTITSLRAGAVGDSFSANMNYTSPVAINAALVHRYQRALSTPATSLLSQEDVSAPCQQVAPGTNPSPEANHADAARLWALVTGKPASCDVSLPCYDFVTSLFMYCMSRPPYDIERMTVTQILNPFQYKEVNFKELAEFMTYTGPYTVANDDSDLACNSESDNMLCRLLNDVISPTLRVCEPWFRPQLNNDDLVTLQKATHGQYLVAASTFLGYFELAFVRARRNFLDMEEDLLTPRCGEVVVMYLQILPSAMIRIVPTELVWLPSEVLESSYTCLRHVIHTLVLANLLHSPAVPQSTSLEKTPRIRFNQPELYAMEGAACSDVQSPCSVASSQRSDGQPDSGSYPVPDPLDDTTSHGSNTCSRMRHEPNVNNGSRSYQLSPPIRPGCQLSGQSPVIQQSAARGQEAQSTSLPVLPGSLTQQLSCMAQHAACTDGQNHQTNWVVNSWDPVGAPAPSAQITPESSPCKSQRSQCSPIPPSVSCTVSPKQGGRTPPTSRSARRLDAMLQQKLLDSLQGTYLPEVNPKEDQCCESLPSRLGFVTDDAVHHVDSPAHMLPGPEELAGLEEQLKPVSGPGGFHVLPLKALLDATPPSTGQHQPLQFSKAEFSFSINTDAVASPGIETAAYVVVEAGGETPQVSPPRITRGPGIAFSLPAMQLPLVTPQHNSSLTDVTMDTGLTTFDASAEVHASVNGFFGLRTPEIQQDDAITQGPDSSDQCGPRVLSECVTPGILSDDDKTCLSPLPSDLLYSTGPQQQLHNYVLNNGSDSGDDAHESLKATSSQGDESDSRSTSTDSDEDDVCRVEDFKFELSAPGIKMPSLSFLVANTKMHCLAPQILQPSCTEMRDTTERPHGSCAAESKRLSSIEMVQEDSKENLERMQACDMPGFSGITWFNPVFVHG